MKPKIASTGTGSTDGLASQLLCKINAMLFASNHNFEYVHLPFDDSFIKGNSGHRYGDFSTAFQNIVFTFPDSELINPISLNLKGVKRLCSSNVARNGTLYHGQDNYFLEPNLSIEEVHLKILEFIDKNSDCELIILDGFSSIFTKDPANYLSISNPTQKVINPKFNFFNHNNYHKSPDELLISFHVRRGDVDKEKYPDRYLSDEYFDAIGSQLESYLSTRMVSYKIFVHTEDEGLKLNFQHLLVTDRNPIRSFVNLSTSDIVVGSRSAHSSVPSIVSGSLALVPSRNWLPCLPHWIKVEDSGKFNPTLLDEYLDNYLSK